MQYQHYNILSLNVNGMNNPIKISKMITKLKKEKVNIAFWQETHLSGPEHEKLRALGILFTHHLKMENGGELPY